MDSIKQRLSSASIYSLAAYVSVFIFIVYTCAYAYRKPFTAGIYEGESLWGFDVKMLYVLAEILGYALSKFIGIRVLTSMKAKQRLFFVIRLISFSEIALLGFATLPVPLKIASIFLVVCPWE